MEPGPREQETTTRAAIDSLGLIAQRPRSREPLNRRIARIALAILSPVALIGAAEVALRAVGFSYAPAPVEILIGDRDPIRVDTQSDPDLFWTMRRGSSFERNETRFSINPLGTRGPLPTKAREPGTFRVVCLGDSTAFGNHTSYPQQLQEILSGLRGDIEVSVINAGVPGFSSWQGLRMLERDLLDYQPDLITWCFGFNNAKAERDGRSDPERAGATGDLVDRAGRAVMQLRLAQAIKRAIDARRTHDAPFNPDRADLAPRVSPTEHRALLSRANDLARASGAKFLAITQPHALVFDESLPLGSAAVPGHDDEEIFATLREQRRRLDAQSYAVRAECQRRSIPLLDLAAALRDKGSTSWCMNPWPGADSIHPNPLGSRYYAERIADHPLVRDALRPREETDGPPMPSFHEGASALVPWSADRDGDGLDEVFCAATHADGVHAAWWNPRSGATRHLVAPGLPRGDQIVTLSLLPALDEILISTRLSEGRMFVITLQANGDAGRVPGIVVPVPGQSAHLFVEPIDLDGDGSQEHLVSYGPAGPNQMILLSDKLRPMAMLNAAGGRNGPWVRAGRILSEEHDHALISFEAGPPDLRIYGADRQFQRWIRPTLGLVHASSRVAPGRYHADSPIDGIVIARGAAVSFLQEDAMATEPSFPFGAVREDLSLPEPGGVVRRGDDRAKRADEVFLATRVGPQITVVKVRNEKIEVAFRVDLP